MTSEEIESKLNKLEDTAGEHGDALNEVNKIRDEVALLRGAIRELATAIKLIPNAYQKQIGGGDNHETWQIEDKADKVLRDLA